MHQPLVVLLLVGLAASAYGLDLSHATKRSTELEPRVLNFFSDLYAQVIYPPLNHVVTNLALLSAQVLASVANNGIPAPNGRTLNPSEDELRGFFSGLWHEAIRPQLESSLSDFALLSAQLLAGVGLNGVNLGIGKRDLTEAEMRGFTDALNHVFTNVIQKPVEEALSTSALLLAQVLAGAGANGINLSSLFGKRDVSDLVGHEAELRGIFTNVGGAVLNGLQNVWNGVFQGPLETFVQNGALSAAQTLADLGVNGVSLGKREVESRGPIISGLVDHATGLFQDQVKPALENALNAAAIHLAGVLAGLSQNLGRR